MLNLVSSFYSVINIGTQ